ncbi:ABC transporter ATP-binding protein [Stygiobacter electus]|uniref:ABC transporter ATP-binding protein n=1 Tax=Stygiobacter electus TaxID=3032292 RepID=A0AAE3P201_9BACT|nr:ABC transporter ATP-binding protein [Stygiobacter electus]MDF1612927.1 ABC transporter ATP-binding protein [Stygiobacter electus]
MIKINNLCKNYGDIIALNSINVSLVDEKLTYLVGPNGSGKTTLIKSILGLIKISSGEIFVDKLRLNGNFSYREKIGYMPQVASFPENLTVEEVIELIKNIRSSITNLDDELINEFNLKKEFNKKIKALSGGTKQKLNAAIAFLFNPKILILDEPTAGLDPISSSLLKDKILKEKSKGKTILLTSHIISELEEVAEEIIFICDGLIFFSGEKNNLISSTGEKNLERAISKLMREKSENFSNGN